MNMKRLLSLVAFFATLQASAQQVNPVPDYVFANRMSAGRNTVTDTAAYFSIGPRYGATRGMMPPMVVDTASFSANKRNGLLIFSVQKNKFLYWDSVGVKWAEMAGTAGTALTSADTAALLSTRAWRQKGIDSLAAIRIGGSGTTSYIPKFTAAVTIGNSSIFDNGSGVGIGTTTITYPFQVVGSTNGLYNINLRNTNSGSNAYTYLRIANDNDVNAGLLRGSSTNTGAYGGVGSLGFYALNAIPLHFTNNNDVRLLIHGNGNIAINSLNDAGYKFDINGTLRSVNSTSLATTSGEVYVGTTVDSGSYILQTNGNIYAKGYIEVQTSINKLRISSYTPASSPGRNIWIGGGGESSSYSSGIQGSRNTSVGWGALFANTTGLSNSALGESSLVSNTSGFENTGVGRQSLYYITSGARNTGIGYNAGMFIESGGNNETTNNSTFIGYETRSKNNGDSNQIVIGYKAVGNGNNSVTIGGTSTTQNYFTGALNTSAPTGGSSKPWRLGEVATVSPTSPNRTIRVEIDGTVYYIHAKTTND